MTQQTQQSQQTQSAVRAREVMWVPARAALAVEIMRDLNDGVTPCQRGLACPVFNRSGATLGVGEADHH